MPTKRPTLADRRRSAILSQTPPRPAQSAPPAATAPAPPAPPAEENEEKNRRDQAASAGMDIVSVCLTPETYRLAKAAFLADWHAGGGADTFGDWIAGACLRHAHLTSAASRPSRNPALRAATQLHHRRPGPGRRGCRNRRRRHRRILDHPLRMGPDRHRCRHHHCSKPCRRYPPLPSPPHPTRPAPQPASAKGFAMTILSLLLPVAVLGFIEVAWWGLRWIEVQQGGAK